MITHSKFSNWTPAEHDLLVASLKAGGGLKFFNTREALRHAAKHRASKRVIDSIRSRAAVRQP